MPADPKPQAVYQCQDPADPAFGSVAVKSALSQFAYGVFSPNNGGHWETDGDTVEKWTLMQAGTG